MGVGGRKIIKEKTKQNEKQKKSKKKVKEKVLLLKAMSQKNPHPLQRGECGTGFRSAEKCDQPLAEPAFR